MESRFVLVLCFSHVISLERLVFGTLEEVHAQCPISGVTGDVVLGLVRFRRLSGLRSALRDVRWFALEVFE